MARMSYPVELQANLLGKSRESYDFENDNGDKVEVQEAYEFTFENADGLAQTVQISVRDLDNAAAFDVAKERKFAAVTIVGNLVVSDYAGRTRVRLVPSQVIKAGAS